MKEHKFKIGDIVTPKTYLISGDIIDFWCVRGGYRYTVIFEDYPAEDFNEQDLVLAQEYVPPHRLAPVENPEDPEEIIDWEVEY